MTYADYDIEVPQGRTTGQIYTKCPKCSHDRKKKHVKCLGVNLDLGVFHCNHCGWKGTINDRKYERPKWENKTDLPESIVEWFLKRNIGQDVLKEMKISHANVWMPQCNAEKKSMCFNYFRNGELINIKYRDSEKNFRLHKDAELILYNLDGIYGKETIYITEGECDALVMIQAGFKSTCSVPNGASKNNNNLEYMDNCWQAFENATKVYILTDTDEPGNKLADELARRIGVERCLRVNFDQYKDVNDVLNAGILITKDWIDEHSRIYPLVGVYDANTFWDDLLYIRKNGFPKGLKPREPLGKHLQIHPGYQTIVTGIPSHGKSEFLDQHLIELGIDFDQKGAYFSPENYPSTIHIIKIVEKVYGKKFWDCSLSEINSTRQWINDHLWWINPEDGFTVKNILEHARKCVLRYGINWYVIDPLNKLEHARPHGMTETEYYGWLLDELSVFNKKNGVHGYLVAHPTKMDKDAAGTFNVPNLYSISGSAHFFNKADIGITVYKAAQGQTDVHIQKVKFKYWGEGVGVINYMWDEQNGRYYTVNPDRSNWLQPKQKEVLIDYSEASSNRGEDDLPF
jgi:twinkle protein